MIEANLLFIFCLFLNGCFGNVEFYPYGPSHGDENAPINDDGSSPEIPISTYFPFFDNQHEHLIVNTNGVISFLRTVSTYTPDPFPLDGDRRLVAIFWADVDTTKGGKVWYRESTNQTTLERASQEVRDYFPSFFRFQATWVFIATWDNVAFYGCYRCDKRNTFQEILITNGQHSFTIFNYKNITWTTGTASGGNRNTGLGGTPAQVGFNAGDGKIFYAVNASRTPAILGINHMSNINIPGKFAFRIDSAEISNGGCNTHGTLTIAPRYGPMLGGQYFVVGGPCMNSDDMVYIQYSPLVTSFPCQRLSNYSALCITPVFNTTGDIKINFTIKNSNGEMRNHQGIYTILNPALFNNPVKRHNPAEWYGGRQYTISWDPLAFELKDSDKVHIHMYTVKDRGFKILPWEKSILHENVDRNLAQFTLNLRSDGYMAAIRVTSAIETDLSMPERGIWTDIFAVVPSHQETKRFCYNWIRQERGLPLVTYDDLPPCPCTLQQALMDTARYQPDPDCNNLMDNKDPDLNCLYRASARHCIRLSQPGFLGQDNVCCYGNTGSLLDSRVEEGGTLQRYHYLGGDDVIPYVTNFYYDVLPFLHCCRYFGHVTDLGHRGVTLFSECQTYAKFRHVSSCYNYVPPRPAGANGDPHMRTVDGMEYNFNGIGEFFFIVSHNASFQSQVRFEQAKNSQGRFVSASVCTAFVAEMSNTSDRVEVRLNSIRVADVIINAQTQDFSDVAWLRYRGVSVLNLPKPTGNSTGRDILVMFADLGVTFRILATKDVLNVMPIIANDQLKGTLTGLLGDFDGNPGNDLLLPDGTSLQSNATEETIFRTFNTAWRIKEVGSMFTYPVGKSYQDYNGHAQSNFHPVFATSIINSATVEAISLCGNNTNCLFDFHVTGSRAIAMATLDFTVDLKDAEDASIPVPTCPILSSTDHGVWVSNNTLENATARFYCNMGYRENSTCRPTICTNGRWENYQPCTCKEIPTVPPPPSTHTTPTGRTPPPATPRDDSLLLRSISDKLQLMWISVGTGVFVVIIIALITALVLCSKFRSRGQYSDSDKHTLSSSARSSEYRHNMSRGFPMSHDSAYTQSSRVLSDHSANSRRSLPRYNVYDNRAYGSSEEVTRITEPPPGDFRRHDVLF